MDRNGLEWNGFQLSFISKSTCFRIIYLQTVAVCVRYICSCVICILHIVNYRVTTQDFLFISSAQRSISRIYNAVIDQFVNASID